MYMYIYTYYVPGLGHPFFSGASASPPCRKWQSLVDEARKVPMCVCIYIYIYICIYIYAYVLHNYIYIYIYR